MLVSQVVSIDAAEKKIEDLPVPNPFVVFTGYAKKDQEKAIKDEDGHEYRSFSIS